jgi:hypothetical protein
MLSVSARLRVLSLSPAISLCARVQADGFHQACDAIVDTVVLIRVKENNFIFGGFTGDAAWSSEYKFVRSSNSFAFSLVNAVGGPVRLRCAQPEYAIVCYPVWGPAFGGGPDILTGPGRAGGAPAFLTHTPPATRPSPSRPSPTHSSRARATTGRWASWRCSRWRRAGRREAGRGRGRRSSGAGGVSRIITKNTGRSVKMLHHLRRLAFFTSSHNKIQSFRTFGAFTFHFIILYFYVIILLKHILPHKNKF